MKIDPRRKHLILKFTPTELHELRWILEPAIREKKDSPVSWLTKSKVRRRLLEELSGVVDGATHSGQDPDKENGDDRFCGSYDDDDRLLSEAYKAAYRAAKRVGLSTSRR